MLLILVITVSIILILVIYLFIERLQFKKENSRLLASAIAIAEKDRKASLELYEIRDDFKIVARDVFRLKIELIDIDPKLVDTDLFVSLTRRLNKYMK